MAHKRGPHHRQDSIQRARLLRFVDNEKRKLQALELRHFRRATAEDVSDGAVSKAESFVDYLRIDLVLAQQTIKVAP